MSLLCIMIYIELQVLDFAICCTIPPVTSYFVNIDNQAFVAHSNSGFSISLASTVYHGTFQANILMTLNMSSKYNVTGGIVL